MMNIIHFARRAMHACQMKRTTGRSGMLPACRMPPTSLFRRAQAFNDASSGSRIRITNRVSLCIAKNENDRKKGATDETQKDASAASGRNIRNLTADDADTRGWTARNSTSARIRVIRGSLPYCTISIKRSKHELDNPHFLPRFQIWKLEKSRLIRLGAGASASGSCEFSQ